MESCWSSSLSSTLTSAVSVFIKILDGDDDISGDSIAVKSKEFDMKLKIKWCSTSVCKRVNSNDSSSGTLKIDTFSKISRNFDKKLEYLLRNTGTLVRLFYCLKCIKPFTCVFREFPRIENSREKTGFV